MNLKMKYKIEDIICIDETSIKSLQKRHHCYSEKGKRCVIKTQSQEVFKGKLRRIIYKSHFKMGV